jgi:hypothetical protein
MDLLLNKEVRNLLFDSLKNKTPRWEIIESLIENFDQLSQPIQEKILEFVDTHEETAIEIVPLFIHNFDKLILPLQQKVIKLLDAKDAIEVSVDTFVSFVSNYDESPRLLQ